MKITRTELTRIIREETMRLTEGGINDKILPFNGEFFELVDTVRELAQKMDVEPAELCAEVANTLRATHARRRA